MIPSSNHVTAPDGTSLFVRTWGKGRPLVFLSGWMLSSPMWSYQMAPLAAQGFRCIAPDRRGHGRSADPGGGYDFDTLADDLEAVLQRLEVERAVLVGHSVASGELVRYIMRHGTRRVAGLVFVAPAATPYVRKTLDNPNGVDEALLDAARDQFATSLPGWLEANAAPFFTPGTPRTAIDWTLQLMLQTSLQAAIELNRSQVSTDFRPELARLDLPSLVIHGDKDASAPLELFGRPTAAAIRGARLNVYPEAPHGLYFTHQAQLNRDIAAFATRVRPDAS